MLVRAFRQRKIEHQVRKCSVKGLIVRNMAGRERDAGRLYESGYKKILKKKTLAMRNALNFQKVSVSFFRGSRSIPRQ